MLPAESRIHSSARAVGVDMRTAIAAAAEASGGNSEKRLCDLAKDGGAYVVGSYPERDGANVYHTIALAGPEGKILGRYRASHLPPSQMRWAKEGSEWVVVPTPIGRIGLALGEELAVPEVFGMLSAMRADVIDVPVEIKNPPQRLLRRADVVS